ncbi:MAG: hypothetical protein KKE89_10170 [Actinobacteria bacterium]|nr:hypothetical protein [Actinomycetota bacterium]
MGAGLRRGRTSPCGRPGTPGTARSDVIWHNGGTYGAAGFLALDRERRMAVAAFGNRGPLLASPIDRVGWPVFDGLDAS